MFALHAVLLLLALMGSRALPPGVHDRSGTGHPPLLDPVVFRNAAFLRMALVPVAGAIGFVAILTYLPSGLQAIHGWSDGEAGAFMMLMTVPVFIAPLVSHRLLSTGLSSARVLALVALACLTLGPLGLLAIRQDVSPIAAAARRGVHDQPKRDADGCQCPVRAGVGGLPAVEPSSEGACDRDRQRPGCGPSRGAGR